MSLPMFIVSDKIAEKFVLKITQQGLDSERSANKIVIRSTKPDCTVQLAFGDQRLPELCMFEHVKCAIWNRGAGKKLVEELEKILLEVGAIDFVDYEDI